jgi:hypothetical protein
VAESSSKQAQNKSSLRDSAQRSQ